MDGASTMYKMRPIIKLAEEIELPKCMYQMKVIQHSYINPHQDSVENNTLATKILEQVNQFLKKPLPEVTALEHRQEAILAQLAELKLQLNTLREHLKQPHLDAHVTLSSNTISYKNGLPEEIVVKANPKHPPYSLLAFYHLSQNSLTIHNHVHSAVNDLTCDLLKQFEKNSVTSPLLNIRLIWKNVSDTELLVSPTKHTAIHGEVNLLRYLSRLGPHLDYESCGNPVETSIIDNLLDTCYQLRREKTAKARQVYLKALSTQLQKSQFLMGQTLSIVDIAAWSAFKQVGCTTSKDLSAGLTRWFQRCNEKFDTCSC